LISHTYCYEENFFCFILAFFPNFECICSFSDILQKVKSNCVLPIAINLRLNHFEIPKSIKLKPHSTFPLSVPLIHSFPPSLPFFFQITCNKNWFCVCSVFVNARSSKFWQNRRNRIEIFFALTKVM